MSESAGAATMLMGAIFHGCDRHGWWHVIVVLPYENATDDEYDDDEQGDLT